MVDVADPARRVPRCPPLRGLRRAPRDLPQRAHRSDSTPSSPPASWSAAPTTKARGRYDYLLTDKGRALWPVMTALRQWGDEWIYGDGNEPLLIEHRSCGCITTAQMTCSACGEALDVRSVRAHTRARRHERRQCGTSAGHPNVRRPPEHVEPNTAPAVWEPRPPSGGQRFWCGILPSMCPKLIVPLQIDLAKGGRRYLLSGSPNPAASPNIRCAPDGSVVGGVGHRGCSSGWGDGDLVVRCRSW